MANSGGGAEGATVILGPSESIQSAVDAAYPGDIIEVPSGTYREKVIVDKPIMLIGVDTGGGRPVVDAGGEGSAIILNASGSLLEGFEVANSGSGMNAGIRTLSDHNVIRNNIVKGNDGYGLLFEGSDHCVVTHNEISDNLHGIGLFNSSESALFLNVFKDNGGDVVSSNSTNQWNSSDPITYRYKERTYSSRLGNHWSDYSGPDLNDDGIGDLPHVFGAERDDGPLIMAGLRPEIVVDKVANVTSGEPGASVKFTIEVKNVGEIEFDHVVVQDLLPDGLEYVGDNRSGTIHEGNVTWILGKLTVGESKRVELFARISGAVLGNVTNHAKAAGILLTEYSLTDEDREILEALVKRVILATEAEFSREVIYVVPPPSALSEEIRDNTHIAFPNDDNDPFTIGDNWSLEAIIDMASAGDIIYLMGWDGTCPLYCYSPANVNKYLFLRGVDVGNGLPEIIGSSIDPPVTLSADECIIQEVIINSSDSTEAIKISSNDNLIIGDIIIYSDCGIRIGPFSGNIIFLNDFIKKGWINNPSAISLGTNSWNSTKKITYRYNGSTFTNYMGNYWSDYSGEDDDNDGIGDEPYEISGGTDKDFHPLMEPIENYELVYGGMAVSKTADRDTAKPGEEITYTITVCNNVSPAPIDVVVEEIFTGPVELVSASPVAGEDGLWRFEDVGPGECRKIELVVKAPKVQDYEFRMKSGVAGEGFVKVADDYSTAPPAYILKNCVQAVFNLNNFTVGTYRDCADVLIDDPGTELSTREYGSGSYESDEAIDLLTENRSIKMNKDVSADHSATTLSLYRNRTVTYSSRWTEEAWAKNRATGASMDESYRYATSIDRESRMKLDQNGSVMEVESEFEGMGRIGFLKMAANATKPETTPLFESWEGYTGSFRVLERIDEYGSGVSSEKAAAGDGLVVVDKRIGSSQRSYESGSGSYDSEEIIETYTSYIAKDISIVHAPMNHSLTGDVSINGSMKWKEGMYSKVPERSYIGEEYTSITELDKETVARGLNEMDADSSFRGQARYRAITEGSLNATTEPTIDFDEQYAGDYSIERRILLEGVPKYDQPHLNLTKTGVLTQEKVVVDNEEKMIDVAAYTITLENDGNKALGPVYLRDLFPPGAAFMSSSLMPSEQTSESAEWTLTHLAIGDRVDILLILDVTDRGHEDLVNRVEASGGYSSGWVNATNFSSIERRWLVCSQIDGVSATLIADVDAADPRMVLYNLSIRNEADITRVITVTDRLPDGMRLISSSVPFSFREDEIVHWNFDLGPFENKALFFKVEALWSGTFLNRAEIGVGSVEGSTISLPIYVNAVVAIQEFDGEILAPGWQPPDWGFNRTICPADIC